MTYRYDAPCGLYCGACGTILADKAGSVDILAKEWGMQPGQLVCHGCKTGTTGDCTFRDCVASKGIEYCFQCDTFPCDELVRFRNDRASHHSVVLRNLRRMREIGVEQWLEEQRLRWSCPNCGAGSFWYDAECKMCGTPLRDCRAEEADLDPGD